MGITARQEKCIELMLSGELMQKEIAEMIKVSENTICNWKKNADFINQYEQRLKKAIQAAASMAFNTQVKLLNAKSETVRHYAAKDILNRA